MKRIRPEIEMVVLFLICGTLLYRANGALNLPYLKK